MDDGTRKIDDAVERDQVSMQARRVRRRALVSAAILTALALVP